MEEIFKRDKVNFVNLHIGNGASLCAIKESKSLDTSMGLTPLAGVMMGTRSGDIDPSIHQFVVNETKMSLNEFIDMLNKNQVFLVFLEFLLMLETYFKQEKMEIKMLNLHLNYIHKKLLTT